MRLAAHRREISVAITYLVLLAALAITEPRFFQIEHLRLYLVGNASIVPVAIGMMLAILARQIDLSVGSQFAIAGVVAGLLSRAGVPIGLVLLLTMCAGALMGAINGVLVAVAGLPAIVVTLATLVIGREGLRLTREGAFVRDLSPDFQWFGLGQEMGSFVIIGTALGVAGSTAFLLRFSTQGRVLYAVGSDAEAARLLGLNPRRMSFLVFVVCGALTALASILNASRFVEVDPNAGNGLELGVIAAVVVGGTSISGGRGTVVGTMLGLLLLYAIGPALVFLGLEPHWERAVQGFVILIAVASDAFERRGPSR